MNSWEEFVGEIEARLQVINKTDDRVSVAFSWQDGRVQQVNIQNIQFAGELVALVTSPILPYSREAADFLLTNSSIALIRTDDDGCLSVCHPLHIIHMTASACLGAIASVAETADEIEKSVTGGADSNIGFKKGESQNDTNSELDDKVISAGQYVVGTDVSPGLYRYSGYVARLDAEMQIIDNDNARSGLGLVKISPHDSYFEVSGEAISLDFYPVYDVLGNGPRGGTYLVGVDIPPGRYRIHADGRSAFYKTYDKNMTRLSSDINKGSLILNLPASVFAVEFTGRLEQI